MSLRNIRKSEDKIIYYHHIPGDSINPHHPPSPPPPPSLSQPGSLLTTPLLITHPHWISGTNSLIPRV